MEFDFEVKKWAMSTELCIYHTKVEDYINYCNNASKIVRIG